MMLKLFTPSAPPKNVGLSFLEIFREARWDRSMQKNSKDTSPEFYDIYLKRQRFDSLQEAMCFRLVMPFPFALVLLRFFNLIMHYYLAG